jgi:uncharacterized protein with PIN domain
MTPIETTGLWKVWPSIKRGLTYVFVLGKRIATLEERVTALEEALKSAPADACPYCGERALRLTHQNLMAMGNHPKRWTEETWTCGKCNKEYVERVPI